MMHMTDAPNATALEAPTDSPVEQPASAPTPAPAAPEPDPALPPRHAELGAWASKQKAQREEQAQREADARDAAAYRAMLAQGYTPREAAQQVEQQRQPDFDPNDFEAFFGRFKGPEEIRQWLKGAAGHIANPNVGRVHREIEQLKQQRAVPEDYEELRAAVQQMQAEKQAAERKIVDDRFRATTQATDDAGSPRYPNLSKLPEPLRFTVANKVIADYRNAGYDGDLPMDFVIQQAEKLLGESNPPAAPAVTTTTPSTRAPTKPRGSTSTRTLTNDLATPQGSPRPDPTDPDALAEWAAQRLAARRRKAGTAA